MRSSRTRLLWILVAFTVVLLIIGVVSGGIYLVTRRGPVSVATWQDPVQAVSPQQVSPDLTLYPLAGALELETLDAALANGDLETAYALLVYAMDLSDAQRVGRLVLLGQRFAEQEDFADRAQLCFQQVYDLAVLSPSLNDAVRSDALLRAGQGWAAMDQMVRAEESFAQVYTLAVASPYLQTATRQALLTNLAVAYESLDLQEKARACREKSIELGQVAVARPEAVIARSPDLPLGDERVSSPEVGALEEARRQAAYGLLQTVSSGAEPPASQVLLVAEALLAEDAAKISLYRQELDATTQPRRRIDVGWQLVRWLMVKYQVAQGALGLSLVPEWETEAAKIQSELSKAYEGLLFDYEDLVTAMPDASLVGPGRYEMRRMIALCGRLGHYPNYPAQQVAEKVQDSVSELIAEGYVDQLYVDVRVDDSELVFYQSPASQYGSPPQGP